jgi:GT2 family glycosyltransferase
LATSITNRVAVIIPTYNRGSAVISVLERIKNCDPSPSEIWIHIDSADGRLESELARLFPSVNVLTSAIRLGAGGGRHRCLQACTTPYAVSFDDDSYPVDRDFFARVVQLFELNPQTAVLGASIWHRREAEKARVESLVRAPSYIGCGYAIRLEAYRAVRGYLPRPVSYGMEETDLSIQLFAAGWHIYEAGDLRVFHDADPNDRGSPELTSGSIANVGLCAFLNYPVAGWSWGLAQVVNMVTHCVRKGQTRGICSGLFQILIDCYHNRRYRNPIEWRKLIAFLHFRKTGTI